MALEGKVDELAEAVHRIEDKMDVFATLPQTNASTLTALALRVEKLEKAQMNGRFLNFAWVVFGFVIAFLIQYALTH